VYVQQLIEKGQSSSAVARAYHLSTQLSPGNESGSNNSSNNGRAKKGGPEGEKEASREGPEGPEAPEDDGIMVVVPTERSIASASLASHHKIKVRFLICDFLLKFLGEVCGYLWTPC
jgi:hypothetical protein